MQDFFRLKNGPFLPLQFVTLFLNFPCTSVESYAWLYVKTSISRFSYYTETTHVPCTKCRCQVFIASSSSQQVPRSYCCTKMVKPLESSHGHHLPTRAASARAARGRCFDPTSGDGTRMKGVLGESRASCRLSIYSRAGSNSGLEQQQYEGLVDNS